MCVCVCRRPYDTLTSRPRVINNGWARPPTRFPRILSRCFRANSRSLHYNNITTQCETTTMSCTRAIVQIIILYRVMSAHNFFVLYPFLPLREYSTAGKSPLAAHRNSYYAIILYIILCLWRGPVIIYYNIDTCFYPGDLIPKPHYLKNFNNSSSVEQRTHSYNFLWIQKNTRDYTYVWIYDI